ncbi:MAG TPA: formyltransferase family protein [Gemmatimonadaceae bacterium]|nr:formyltransferase family protein [Gemmatimonadaceae bacterium]
MRIAILTSLGDGLPSLCIPRIAQETDMELVAVIQSEGRTQDRAKSIRRRLKKIRRIGVVGALNARRFQTRVLKDLRNHLATPSVEESAAAVSRPFFRTPHINSDATRRILREARADLGISLGNSWIAESVFRIPRLGMINIHHEVLPAYRGAQSVIWQLYNGSTKTGYTIHEIDRGIDTGRILHLEIMDIDLKPDFRGTVSATTARLQRASVEGLLHALRNYKEVAARGTSQGPGATYTSPTLRQYIHMLREHKKLYRLSGKRPGS